MSFMLIQMLLVVPWAVCNRVRLHSHQLLVWLLLLLLPLMLLLMVRQLHSLLLPMLLRVRVVQTTCHSKQRILS